MSDIVINKTKSIHRCIERARDEYRLADGHFQEDYSRQDAAVLNITRACEQAIDLANYVIKKGRMGMPNSSADCFSLLARDNVISLSLGKRLEEMVGFRNLAVHEYKKIDLNIVETIISAGLDDLVEFCHCVVEYAKRVAI